MALGARGVEAAPEGARRVQRWLFLLAILGVATGTVGGWTLATVDEREENEQVADALAQQAAASLETVVGRALGGLRGAGGLVDADGVVDRAAFRAFAEGIVGEQVEGLALGVRIDSDDRDAFEAAEDPIVRRGSGGAFEPAPRASEYFPLVEVVSPDRSNQRILGFDYDSDPVRGVALERARDEGTPVLSPPTRLTTDERLGFVVVQPLYERGARVRAIGDRRDAFVGFVTVAYGAADVLAELQRGLPPGTGVAVTDGGIALFEAGIDDDPGRFARTTDVMVPGRTWSLTVVPAQGASTTLANLVVAGGVIAGLGLSIIAVVTWRYQRRLRTAYGSQRQSQQRSETLEGLAARLSRSLSSVEVGEALLEQLPPFTGTTAGAVLVLDQNGEHLHLLAADGYDADRLLDLQTISLAVPSALADVVNRGEPAWLPSPLSWRADPATAALGDVGRAAAIVPLVADRSVAGVLVLVHPGVRGFYEDERSLLTTVAALAARALNRALRYDVEHDAAVVLQRALLPSVLPTLPDVDVAVRYLPATGGFAVGGDWYDVFPLGDGRIGVVVGDVVGRGVKAAAAMGRLRSALRALADVVPEPTALLRHFEAHVPTIPDALCATMVYAVVDPAAGRITYLRAGHPPPLLLRPGAPARLLDEVVSPPLGVTGGAPATAVTLAFEPGDTLVLYTDGIVERRGEAVTVGLERLREVGTSAAELDPEDCCDCIVDAMLGDAGHGDDAAVVAVRLLATRLSGPGEVARPTPTAVS